MEPDKGAEHKG